VGRAASLGSQGLGPLSNLADFRMPVVPLLSLDPLGKEIAKGPNIQMGGV